MELTNNDKINYLPVQYAFSAYINILNAMDMARRASKVQKN